MSERGEIGAKTRVCAVIGNPLGHSLSPAIHNAAYAACGLDFVYVAFQTASVEAAAAALRGLDNLAGFSVTIPHKLAIMGQVDEIGDLDRRIGSINTVVKEDGRLVGLGTDGAGALKALRDAGVDAAGRRILMLGAGGAARAIAFTLADQVRPAAIDLLDIDEGALQALAGDLRDGTDTPIHAAVMNDKHLAECMAQADILIHGTPVGMHPKTEATLVPPELFRDGQVVFDIVYNPLHTRLLRDARERGLRIIPGAEMFVNQAVLQFERFTGHSAPVEVMRNVVMENLQS
jgi:shikimate dehydrogenase